MNQTATHTDPADVILEAAINRFSEYGYNKTTMAEIAEDASMSAANIYRYFKNKQDIAVVCARNNVDDRINLLKQAIRNPALTAAQKLESYALTTLRFTHDKALENKKIDEICSEITKHRPDLVHHKVNNEQALLMEILAYGNQTGEFNIDNVVETAEAIHAMLIVFDVPMFMHLFSWEEYENRARVAVQILLSGLSRTNNRGETE